jgi:hypothetical protein
VFQEAREHVVSNGSGAKEKKRNQQKDMAKNDFTAKHQEHAKMVVGFEDWM